MGKLVAYGISGRFRMGVWACRDNEVGELALKVALNDRGVFQFLYWRDGRESSDRADEWFPAFLKGYVRGFREGVPYYMGDYSLNSFCLHCEGRFRAEVADMLSVGGYDLQSYLQHCRRAWDDETRKMRNPLGI